MAENTGDEGSISFGGVAMGEILEWNMSGAESAIIENTTKGQLVRTFRAGRKNMGTISVRGQVDLITTAQNAWWDEVTDGVIAANATIVATIATGKTFTFQALPTGGSVGSPEGDSVAPIELEAQINSTIVTAAA